MNIHVHVVLSVWLLIENLTKNAWLNLSWCKPKLYQPGLPLDEDFINYFSTYLYNICGCH